MHRHAFELEAELLERRRGGVEQGLGELNLVRCEVEEGHAAARHGIGNVLQHQAAQLAVEVGHGVGVARARDLGVEQLGIGDAVAVVAEGAQAHGAEVLVADRHRLGRAPALVDLLARAEEVHVALERAFEEFVPVLQVGEHRQRGGDERVAAGAEHIGHLAFVDEHRQLRFAHREGAAVLDLAVLHREAPGQRAVARLRPFDDIDELFLDEIHQRHGVKLPRLTRKNGCGE